MTNGFVGGQRVSPEDLVELLRGVVELLNRIFKERDIFLACEACGALTEV